MRAALLAALGLFGLSATFAEVVKDPALYLKYKVGTFTDGVVMDRLDHGGVVILVIAPYPVPVPVRADGALADTQVIPARCPNEGACATPVDEEKPEKGKRPLKVGDLVEVEGRVRRLAIGDFRRGEPDLFYIEVREVRRTGAVAVPSQEFAKIAMAVAGRARVNPLAYGLGLLAVLPFMGGPQAPVPVTP